MIHGRRIERAAAGLAAAAALLAAALPSPAAAADLAGRVAYSTGAAIGTIEGDGSRPKTAFNRFGSDWATLTLADPAYSPDGRRIAIAGSGLGVARIGVIDADGHTGQPLTLAPQGARPAFSADGKTIAFEAADGVYTVPAGGGEPTKLELPAGAREPTYSRDGRLLAFSALDGAGDRRVFVKNLDDGAVVQVTTGGGEQSLPAFTPDGAQIVYVNTPLAPGGGSGLPELGIRRIGGGAPDILWSNQVEPDRFVTGRPAVAPDGSRVAFTVTRPGDEQCPGDLMIVDLEGAPNPRAIGCSTGSVDWAVRTAKGVTKLVSSLPGSSRESGDGDVADAVTAADGRYVVFTSAATNLAAGVTDDNEATDIFRRDLASGRTELISADKDGGIANGPSEQPLVDADGSSVVFHSKANDLIAGATVGSSTVYMRQADSRFTQLVSRSLNRALTGANGDNRPVAISPSGRYVLWSSTGTNVVEGQGESAADTDVDLFLFDSLANQTHAVNVRAGSTTASGNGGTGAAFVSDDGKTVVFESTATDLVPGFVDRNGDAPSIFRRDLATGTTTLVDGADGSATESAAGTPRLLGISADGHDVLFTSTASDVVAGFEDGNGDGADLYVRRHGAKASLVSGTSATKGANGGVGEARIASGRVFWDTDATDLNDDFTTEHEQVWTRALSGGAPTGAPQLVTRGTRSDHGGDGPSRVADASADGSTVVVSSHATDLTAPLRHHDDTPTLYRITVAGFDAEPVSARGDDAADAVPVTRRGTVAADGKVIAYTTRAGNLLDGFIDGNGPDAGDAFAWLENSAAQRDPIAPTVTITTPVADHVYRQESLVLAEYRCDDEGPSGLKSCDGTVADGQPIDTSDIGTKTFTVRAVDNAGNVTQRSVTYRVAAANKKLALASRTNAPAKTANSESRSPVFSADGRYLVFTSGASDLVDGFIDGNGVGTDVYRRDLHTGVTELVSVGLPRGGDNGRPRGVNQSAETQPRPRAVSPDGRYVLFESAATDITAEHSSPAGVQLWLRDMQEGVTMLVTHRPNGSTGGAASPGDYGFSRDGRTVVFSSTAPALVAEDTNGARDVFTYSVATGAVTLISVDSTGQRAAAGYSDMPEISDDGRRVAFRSTAFNLLPDDLPGSPGAHTYWRDLDTGTTKLVDHTADDPAKPAAAHVSAHRLSGDGKRVVFETIAGDVVAGFDAGESELPSQIYLRDVIAGGPATLVTAAHDNPARGTGGTLYYASVTPDASTIAWTSNAKDVVAGFVDHNDNVGWSPEPDLYVRRFDGAAPAGPAKLAAHGPEGENHGLTFAAYPQGISADGRFVVVHTPTRQCDCSRYSDDVTRLDIKRNRFNNVAQAANDPILEFAASEDAKRIAFTTEADNLLDGFEDTNGRNFADVFSWHDAPPVANAEARVTGSLKLAFDATGSSDPDGEILYYSWRFGDGAEGEGPEVEHRYDDERLYDVVLTVEDDGGNEVAFPFEVVAIKGVLTTGPEPVQFIGVDKHLRCSVLRDGPVLAQGGGACGTFVAVDGTTYGPPELVDGVEPFTPVSQERSEDGDVATLVTVVTLGDTGLRVRQTDAYKEGKAWYRTDVELLNDGAMARTATVYRGARCAIGEESGRRSLHDAATSMAGCDGAALSGRLVAGWLPLTAGARRDAGAFAAVAGRIAAGAPLADTCACGAQPDPAAAIGWSADVPADGSARFGSLAAFGPDGSIPLTLAFKADKGEVQPLDDNAFTVTLRNPNAGDVALPSIAVDSDGAWDPIPGSTTGLTGADPAVEGTVATWAADMKVPGHGTGELRFGVTHRSGQRTSTSVATPAGEVANLAAASLAELASASATVVARSIEGSLPNTAITSGPTGPTRDRDPAFRLEASKDDVSYECRFEGGAWAPCEGNPHRPGPLADGAYVLEARAVDAVGADETPARRAFSVDTAAPTTVISRGPRGLTTDPRPAFFFSSNEPGARFECRLEGPGRAGAWFACENPYRPAALPDGAWLFEVRALDAAGNVDETPARLEFTIDTTPPVTVIDGITGKVLASPRASSPSVDGGGGSTVALGADGAAALNVACPENGPACEGVVGLAQTPPTAGAAQANRRVPDNAVTLARAEFNAQPGETVAVKLPLSVTVRNTLERVGKMAVFITIDAGTGRPVRGSDVVLTPDPRTARLLDAGRTVKVKKGRAKLRLRCAAERTCRGTIKIGARSSAAFAVRAGKTKVVRVRIRKNTRRGRELPVRLTTRNGGAPALTKRLTLTLEGRR